MNASKPGMNRISDADAPDLATPSGSGAREGRGELRRAGCDGARRAARSTLDVHCAGRGPGADGPVATASDSSQPRITRRFAPSDPATAIHRRIQGRSRTRLDWRVPSRRPATPTVLPAPDHRLCRKGTEVGGRAAPARRLGSPPSSRAVPSPCARCPMSIVRRVSVALPLRPMRPGPTCKTSSAALAAPAACIAVRELSLVLR